MKILMLNDSMVRGGRERRLIELLKGLAQFDDIECELLLLSDRVEYPEIYEMNIPIHILERKPAKDPRIFYRLVKLCRRIKPDVIHSWAMMSSVYALAPKIFLGTKFINAG
ncbi:MAG: glycosyltransferase, partial [Bacteroidetes bacterium]|nr:glycosyltransferase [Bacteroidota bacterium]